MAQSFDSHSSAVSYTRQSDYTHVSGQVYGQATYLEDWYIPNRGSKQDEFGRHAGVFVLTNVAALFYVMGEGKVSLRGSGFLGGRLPFDKS